jgi:hypothetical protein
MLPHFVDKAIGIAAASQGSGFATDARIVADDNTETKARRVLLVFQRRRLHQVEKAEHADEILHARRPVGIEIEILIIEEALP